MVIAARGTLTEIATERGLPLVRIPADEREPQGFQPRSATGYFVGYLVRMLEAVGLLSGAVDKLREVPEFLAGVSADIRATAEKRACWLEQRIPVIITDDCYEQSIGRICTIKLNENTKRPAMHAVIPEANHNLMIGFSRPLGILGATGWERPYGTFGFLYLYDPDSDPRVHQRFEVLHEIFAHDIYRLIELDTWRLPGRTKIQKIFAALTFADWCSYTLALLAAEDPTPVDLVEDFKKRLAERLAEPPTSHVLRTRLSHEVNADPRDRRERAARGDARRPVQPRRVRGGRDVSFERQARTRAPRHH